MRNLSILPPWWIPEKIQHMDRSVNSTVSTFRGEFRRPVGWWRSWQLRSDGPKNRQVVFCRTLGKLWDERVKPQVWNGTLVKSSGNTYGHWRCYSFRVSNDWLQLSAAAIGGVLSTTGQKWSSHYPLPRTRLVFVPFADSQLGLDCPRDFLCSALSRLRDAILPFQEKHLNWLLMICVFRRF